MECRALFPESRGTRPLVLMGKNRHEDPRAAAVSSNTTRSGKAEPRGRFGRGRTRSDLGMGPEANLEVSAAAYRDLPG